MNVRPAPDRASPHASTASSGDSEVAHMDGRPHSTGVPPVPGGAPPRDPGEFRAEDGFVQLVSTLFAEHRERLVGVAERVLVERGAAEDVVQEVALAVLELGPDHYDRLRPSYLVTAVRRRAMNRRRADANQRDARERVGVEIGLLHQPPPDPWRSMERECARELLDAAVAELPSWLREVFVLTEQRGLSHREAGAALGLSRRTVGEAAYRARRAVRESLRDRGVQSLPDVGDWSP